jgi:hypothetical protein
LAETPAPRPNPARVCVAPLGSADAAPVGRPALGCGARYALSEILGAPGAASVLVEAEASDLAPARPRDMSLGF